MDLEPENLTGCASPVLTASHGFILTVKVVVGLTCILSIFGGSLIIFTYVVFRDLRTTARHLLVHLSVADVLVAASHFLGLLTNYDRFYSTNCTKELSMEYTDLWCATQGGVTVFATIASFLWTIAVALYLFVIIVLQKPGLGKKLVFVFYVVCWGVPTIVVIAFGVKGYLGFEKIVDIGWCSLRRVNTSRYHIHNYGNSTIRHYDRSIIPQVVGYEMWVYLVFIVLPVLYVWIRCYVRIQLRKVDGRPSLRFQSRIKTADLKLIFVPLIFLLLRIWSFVLDVIVIYLKIKDNDDKDKFQDTKADVILILLSGVGDSAQGFANAILFCLCTRVVRQKLCLLLSCYCCRREPLWIPIPSTTDGLDDPTEFEEDTASLLLNRDSPEEEPIIANGRASMEYTHTYSSIDRPLSVKE